MVRKLWRRAVSETSVQVGRMATRLSHRGAVEARCGNRTDPARMFWEGQLVRALFRKGSPNHLFRPLRSCTSRLSIYQHRTFAAGLAARGARGIFLAYWRGCSQNDTRDDRATIQARFKPVV